MPAKKASTSSIRARLTEKGFGSGTLFLDGIKIGSYVSKGQLKPGAKRSDYRKTIYCSRIYHPKISIQEEAATTQALLNKVASKLAAAMNEGLWEHPAPTS